MKKQDLISIVFTFIVGVFGGSYLYVTGFADFASKVGIPDANTVSEFILVSDIYGKCEDACPSFQVVNDGSYRYLYTPNIGAEPILKQGTLPLPLQRKLKSALDLEELESQSKPIETVECASNTDGIDVIYEITMNAMTYNLDSCGTAIDPKSELWTTLNSLWEYFEKVRNN